VRRPWLALMAARLQVMVDFPTPPFWLNTTSGMAQFLVLINDGEINALIVPGKSNSRLT
jgi:hypothetical protein